MNNAQAIKRPLLPGGTMVLMRDGKPTRITFETFVDRVGRPGTTHVEERIQDPLVRIDHDLAMVWARFELDPILRPLIKWLTYSR